jgi:hypothetical protein
MLFGGRLAQAAESVVFWQSWTFWVVGIGMMHM